MGKPSTVSDETQDEDDSDDDEQPDDQEKASLLQDMLGIDEPALRKVDIDPTLSLPRRSTTARIVRAIGLETPAHVNEQLIDVTCTPVAADSHWVRFADVGVSFPCSRKWHLYRSGSPSNTTRFLGAPVTMCLASQSELPVYADSGESMLLRLPSACCVCGCTMFCSHRFCAQLR